MMDQFKIFLSYKHHDKDGAITRDHELTQIIYKNAKIWGCPHSLVIGLFRRSVLPDTNN